MLTSGELFETLADRFERLEDLYNSFWLDEFGHDGTSAKAEIANGVMSLVLLIVQYLRYIRDPLPGYQDVKQVVQDTHEAKRLNWHVVQDDSESLEAADLGDEYNQPPEIHFT